MLMDRLKKAVAEDEAWIDCIGTIEEIRDQIIQWEKPHAWGDSILLFVAARVYGVNFAVYSKKPSEQFGKFRLFSPHYDGLSLQNMRIDRESPLGVLYYNGLDHFEVIDYS